MMAISATLAPNVLGYIEKSFYLHTSTRFYKQLLDYSNITQMVNTITKPKFENLDFLIPKTGLIPKTMVFVDKIDDAITLAACLQSLLPPEQRHQDEVLIRTYHSNFETSTQLTFLEDFWTREIRI